MASFPNHCQHIKVNGTHSAATVFVTSTNVTTKSASRSPQTAPKALAAAAVEPLSTCLSSRMPTRSKSR